MTITYHIHYTVKQTGEIRYWRTQIPTLWRMRTTSTRTPNINFWNNFCVKTSYPVWMNGRICTLSLELLTIFFIYIYIYTHTHTHTHTSIRTDRKEQSRTWNLLVTIPRRICQVWSYCFKSCVQTWDASVVGVVVGLRNVASLHTRIRSLSDDSTLVLAHHECAVTAFWCKV